MGSFNDVIDAMRKAPTNVDRGTLFEQLMVRYFQLDPTRASPPPSKVSNMAPE